MRTALDFDRYYATPDPWRAKRATVRDRNLFRAIASIVRGKSVLELGCGEGHLTRTILGGARSVRGVDISQVAIERASKAQIQNASFATADFLNVPLSGYDVILAIECMYYLSEPERAEFLRKLSLEHANAIFAFSTPIIGGKYFSHHTALALLRGFDEVRWHNLTIYWSPISARIAANMAKLPPFNFLVDRVPEPMVYQRLYVARVRQG